MAPKGSAKRKAPDGVAASSAQQAPAVAEPVMPDLASLPEEDATILAQVVSLGRYPRRMNERNLLRRLERRTKSMDPQCLAFLEAVRKHGSVEAAQEAALTSAPATATAASSSRAAEPVVPPSGAASSSCASVLAGPAEPKRNAKRKSSDAASLEHLYQDALRQKTSNNNHVQILEYVHDLGHYPQRIPGGCAEPTDEQRFEDIRRQQIERMWTDLPRTYTRYLEALKKLQKSIDSTAKTTKSDNMQMRLWIRFAHSVESRSVDTCTKKSRTKIRRTGK